MTRMDKETARRSLDEFLRRLPNGAVVEIVEHEEPPPPGVGVRVKIDMWTNPDRRQRAEVRGEGSAGVAATDTAAEVPPGAKRDPLTPAGAPQRR